MDVQHAREAPTEHPQWEFEDEDEEDNSKADESDDQVSIYFISNRTSFIKEISHYCKTTFLSVGKGLKICMSFVQVMIKYHLVVSLCTICSILNIIQPLHLCSNPPILNPPFKSNLGNIRNLYLAISGFYYIYSSRIVKTENNYINWSSNFY